MSTKSNRPDDYLLKKFPCAAFQRRMEKQNRRDSDAAAVSAGSENVV